MLTSEEMERLERWDKQYVWHPFTPMQPWCADDHHPLVLVRGEGAWLWDVQGRRYLDGNSTIWTNTLGHGHPRLMAALLAQSREVAHTSFLGFTNKPAIELAEALVRHAPGDTLTRVFYSDNGSTAVEVAVRQALQYHQLTGARQRQVILAFDHAYHGDTLGAASLGGIPLFHGIAREFGYEVYRLKSAADLAEISPEMAERVAAVIIEPLVQGAAGIRIWPMGLLRQLREWCDRQGALLILDEIMTAFGRTGTMFACQQEGVTPDFLCLAKGLTGGTMPLAATLTTETVFNAFLGQPSEGKTFYYGHSYCGNPLAAAVALEHLRVWVDEEIVASLPEKLAQFTSSLQSLAGHRHVKEIRQCGLIAGVEICQSRDPFVPFPPTSFMGAKVCLAAREFGLLTRPILDTIVLMPPLCCGTDEFEVAVQAIEKALEACLT